MSLQLHLRRLGRPVGAEFRQIIMLMRSLDYWCDLEREWARDEQEYHPSYAYGTEYEPPRPGPGTLVWPEGPDHERLIEAHERSFASQEGSSASLGFVGLRGVSPLLLPVLSAVQELP